MGSYRAIGEFPPRIVPTLIGGEGIRYIFLVRQHMETHKGVYERRTPCTSIAKTVLKQVIGGKNERVTENQN